MSWFPHVRVLLLIGILASTALAQKDAKVEQISVRGAADGLEVEIRTSGQPISPNTQAITGPDRIVVDFPGALPSAVLRSLKVNRGPLKEVRSGLFFENPPITRIVLDLTQGQSYRIVSENNLTVVKLGATSADVNELSSARSAAGAQLVGDVHREVQREVRKDPGHAALVSASSAMPIAPPSTPATASETPLGSARGTVSGTTSGNTPGHVPVRIANGNGSPEALPKVVIASAAQPASATTVSAVRVAATLPAMNVSYENGMLRIHAEKVPLSQVLFEVHLKTHADIPIPAGAEQEQVVADIGPGPARDVLGALLNGSPYNFIFVGNENSLERVILTRRESGNF